MNMDDLAPLVEKIWQDPSSHSAFAEVVAKVSYLRSVVRVPAQGTTEVFVVSTVLGFRDSGTSMQGPVHA